MSAGTGTVPPRAGDRLVGSARRVVVGRGAHRPARTDARAPGARPNRAMPRAPHPQDAFHPHVRYAVADHRGPAGARLRVVVVLTVGPARIVMPRRGVRHVLECGLGADLRPHDVLRLGYAGQSGKDHADQGIDGQGGQGNHHREDLDDPADPGRKGHRHSPGGVGRDDAQELQQRPHTSSSAIALPV
jgi:hypothetical protein